MSSGPRRITTIIRTNSWARATRRSSTRRCSGILKPGGTYIVIDHKAEAGAEHARHRAPSPHRAGDGEAAGRGGRFRLVGERRARNPNDPLNIPVFDEAIRGHTSQFAYKFVKP